MPEDYTIVPRSDIGKLYDKLHRLVAEKTVKLEHRLEHLEDQIIDVKKRVEELKSALEKLREEFSAIREDIAIEARERVASYLASEKGIEVELRPLETSSLPVFDIYGTSGLYTIIGRAYVVVSKKIILSLLNDVELLASIEPSLLYPNPGKTRLILAVYALRALLEKNQIAEMLHRSPIGIEEIVIVTPQRGEIIS